MLSKTIWRKGRDAKLTLLSFTPYRTLVIEPMLEHLILHYLGLDSACCLAKLQVLKAGYMNALIQRLQGFALHVQSRHRLNG